MKAAAIVQMRAKANRCRQLAANASDPEAAKSLLQVAGDIETVMPLLEFQRDISAPAKDSRLAKD